MIVWKDSSQPYLPEIAEEREEKAAIIGAGPAGLGAAYFLRKRGYQVTVFEKLPEIGRASCRERV